jgi:hypothetical protein
MPRRLASLAAAALCVPALVLGLSGNASAVTPTATRDGTASSTNWAGYAVTPSGGHVTAVSASFAVPTAGFFLPGFAATWAGIGGFNTRDLIQAGVAEQSLPSTPLLGDQYDAWYELLPGSPVQLTGCMGDVNCTVRPGDQITLDIAQVGTTNEWTIAMVDADHWIYSKTVAYTSSGSSAEWILEAPSLLGLQSLLAGVGTERFGPSNTFTVGGNTETIGQGNPTQINQTSPLGFFNESTTSALAADGQSFDVCAYAQSCATP